MSTPQSYRFRFFTDAARAISTILEITYPVAENGWGPVYGLFPAVDEWRGQPVIVFPPDLDPTVSGTHTWWGRGILDTLGGRRLTLASLASAFAACNPVTNNYYNVGFPDSTDPEIPLQVGENYLRLAQQAIAAWTEGGDVTLASFGLIDHIPGWLREYWSVLRFDDGTTQIDVRRSHWIHVIHADTAPLDPTYIESWEEVTNGLRAPGSVISQGMPGVERLAEAVEAIAMSRIEVSMNNGAQMFSVTGGTRAEGD